MKVALLVTCLSLSSLISCSTLQHVLNSDQKDASGLAASPRGDGADVIDPESLDTKADSQMASSSDSSNMNMDSLSLDTPQESSMSASSELQTEVQMDQAPMEHTPVAEAPAMDVAPQSEMADASHEEVAVSGPIETPAIEVFDNQSVAQEQQRAFSSPKKHSAKMEKKSSKKIAKFSKKDKKGKKLAIAKKESKKSKLAAKKSLKKEKLAKGSKAKKGMVAKSSKSKKVVKGSKSSKSKVVSSKSNKKGKKDRKVASSK